MRRHRKQCRRHQSFIATLSASARLVAHWKDDAELLEAGAALPAGLRDAASQDWSTAVETLRDSQRLMVIGRGAGFAIAQEAALKFKETSAIRPKPSAAPRSATGRWR